jgi:REP element-mobilizing transposase RayT
MRLIDGRAESFLRRYLPSIARQERARILDLGIVGTHVHVLIRTHPTTVLPRLLQRFKGGSAAIANKEGHVDHGRKLRWAKGYNIETVSRNALAAVRHYVRLQAERHPTEQISARSDEGTL